MVSTTMIYNSLQLLCMIFSIKLNYIFDLSDLYIITSINMRYSNINMSNIDVRIDPAYRAKYIEFLNNFFFVHATVL